MIRRLGSFVAGAAALTLMMSAAPGHAAGALAVGKCGGYGYANNEASLTTARDVALQKCVAGTQGCRVVLDFHKFCVAFAWDTGRRCGAQGWDSAADQRAASDAAVRQCVKSGGSQCVVRKVICDTRG